MYSVGEISKMVKISIDSLRYYDEIGLLKPHYIDPSSRYRYYSEDQVKDFLAIVEWKKYGFSLDAIRELLDCSDAKRLVDILQAKVQQLLVERSNVDRSIDLLQARIQKLGVETALDKKTVLIIDDAPFMRKVLAEILETHGLHVIGSAADGEEGIAAYLHLKPDFVILDIGMPGMDGIEVLRRLRKIDSSASVIMCSARGQIRTILESIKEGANDFIVKPFQQESILDTLFSRNNRQFEYETVASILEHDHIDKITDPLSQDSINDLLRFCTGKYQANDADTTKIWSSLGLLP
ncbi:MAG: response regulator [Paenibacillaceae bacterium]|nr:response regulator [Paenibacillaceae bacterium]